MGWKQARELILGRMASNVCSRATALAVKVAVHSTDQRHLCGIRTDGTPARLVRKLTPALADVHAKILACMHAGEENHAQAHRMASAHTNGGHAGSRAWRWVEDKVQYDAPKVFPTFSLARL